MDKKIGLFWLRDDFRLTKNNGLIEATRNHDQVVVFYLFKNSTFKYQEAQKWWLSKSLFNFQKSLDKFNINLEIIKIDSFKVFFEKLLKKKDFSIYWNKVYEPDYLKFDEYLLKNLKTGAISYKICKGNVLNEIGEVKKSDGTPFRVFTPFWRHAEKYYFEKIPPKEKKIKKCQKKKNYLKDCIDPIEILPKNNWFKNFEKIWKPTEENALKELQNFIKTKITNYSDSRNFPNVIGTSKLSPFIRFGQLHVETIWDACMSAKNKSIGTSKFLAEIGWREFNHTLINNFPHMIKIIIQKNLINFHGKKTINFYLTGKEV